MISFRTIRDITGTGCGSVLQMDELSPRRKAFSGIGLNTGENNGNTHFEK